MKKLVVLAVLVLVLFAGIVRAFEPSDINTGLDDIVRFAIKGDWTYTPSVGSAQIDVTSRMCEVIELTGARNVLTVGDNFKHPDGLASVENYWIPEECLYSNPDVRLWPA